MATCLATIAPLLGGAPINDELAVHLERCRDDVEVQVALVAAIFDGTAHPEVRSFRPLFVWWEDPRLVKRLLVDAAAEPLGPPMHTLAWWLDEVRPPKEDDPFLTFEGQAGRSETWLVAPSCGCAGGAGGSVLVGNVLVLHPDAHAGSLRVERVEDRSAVAHIVCGCPGVGTVWVDRSVRDRERQEADAWRESHR